jgi:linoleoyl-CoA desaturase
MLTYFSWVWYADFKKYFSRKINGHDIGKASMNEHIIFWSSKFFYAFYIIAVPVYYLGWQEALIGYGILCATCGLFISIVFQLAHVVEGVDNPIVVEGNVIKEEWARHEIQTTANFATHNRLVNWYCGGLNFQIEHHLFPGINHIHYSRMSPVVKEMCKKFGIVYNEKPTIAIALKSHFNYLKSIGAKP